jgi:hypothetical protein
MNHSKLTPMSFLILFAALILPSFVFGQGSSGSNAFEKLISNKWSLTDGMPCSLNGGAFEEYGEKFKTGERLTTGGNPYPETPNNTTKQFAQNDDGSVSLYYTVYANDLVAKYSGSRNTKVAVVERKFFVGDTEMRVESVINMLDLEKLLSSRQVQYTTQKESSIKQLCD